MIDLKKIIELAKEDGGKFFVMDEMGQIRLVIMSLEDYQKMRSCDEVDSLSQRLANLTEQTEELNRQIAEIQLDDAAEPEEAPDGPSFPNDSDDASTFYIEPIEEKE